MGFGSKLRLLRQKKKMSQQKVADELQISVRAYSNYECHDIIPRDPELIVRMANFFHVDKSYLMVVAPSNLYMEANIFQRTFNAENDCEQAQLLARDIIMQLDALYASGKLGSTVEDEIAMEFSKIYFRTKLKNNIDNSSKIK